MMGPREMRALLLFTAMALTFMAAAAMSIATHPLR